MSLLVTAESTVLGKRTLEFVERVDQLDSEQAVIDEFDRTLKCFGVKYFALGEVAGVAAEPSIQVGNYPEEWLHYYIDNKLQTFDPVARMALRSPRSFDWSEVEAAGLIKGKGRKLFSDASDVGLRAGKSIPIYQQNGYLAVASFSDEVLDPDPKVMAALELITLYFHTRLVAIREADPSENTKLSGREAECLHWAAAGKTDWEIGEILTISQETSHRHIENAKRKMGVTTRVQAIIHALRRREISV